MKIGDQLVIVRDVDPPKKNGLIAALTALGIPLDDGCPYQETREMVSGKEQRVVTWVLKTKSLCGAYDTVEMMGAWENDAFCSANPEHPLSYIKQAFANRETISEQAEIQAPLALIRKGRRMVLIPMDATPERRAELIKALES